MEAQMYNINIRPGWGIPPTVKVSQYDVGRPLAFVLMDGQEALSIASGTTVTMEGTKPSGLGFTQACTLDGNTATISTVATMTQEAGCIPCELVVAVGNTTIGTANFKLVVELSAHPEGTTDGDAETARDLMTRAEQAVEQAEAAAESISQAGIDTTGSTAGQVPTSNGNGGWSWQTPQAGGGGTSDDIENVSSVSGATVTGALNSLSDEIATESSRIDNIVALPEGSTTGDAELMDIRVGANGTTYASAGAAVRGQVSGLQTEIGDLSELDTEEKTDLVSAINEASASGGGITTQQWDYIIALFRGALYDTTIIADPKSVIDSLEDSIDTIPATNIRLSTNTLSFANGTAQTVTVSLSPSNTTDRITAVCGDTSVATVAVNNRAVTVTPVANGNTSITITTTSGLTATVSVTVDLPQLFSVTNTLTGCTTSNEATSIYEDESYSATLTADTDYTINSVVVTMGGTDISATAWDSATGAISIASVTGDIIITAIATTPVLYALPQPYVSSGDADNYINTRLMLGETDQDFSIAGYIKFDYAFPNMNGTNKQILYLGKPTDNTQFGFNVYNSMYSVSGIGSGTPKDYNHRQNVKFVITHQAGSLDIDSKLKYFDQEDSTKVTNPGTGKKSFTSFVACENPLYIGKRTDGYGICNYLTLQSLKIFNYVMDSTAIDNYISTEEATI